MVLLPPTRGHSRWLLVSVLLALIATGCSAQESTSPPQCGVDGVVVGAEGEKAADIVATEAADRGLTSALFRVTRSGEVVAEGAYGENTTGVPLTGAEHFRNGNVAFAYLGTLLLLMAEAGELDLDDPVSRWLPDRDLPEADRVTLRMLADHTSGYPDYVPDEGFLASITEDPFRSYTPDELIEIGLAEGPLYPPGTAWNYSHTNYVLLGEALAAAAGQDLGSLLQERVITPMGLDRTASASTPALPEPALHTFTTERGPFEETTFWNPSWQTAPGAVLTTTICDLAESAAAVGTGRLLTESSFADMTADSPVQHRPPPADCPPEVCRSFPDDIHFGLGVVVVDDWIVQTPMFAGQGTIHAYLPAEDLAVAIVAVAGLTSDPEVNHAQQMWSVIAAELFPDHAPSI